MLNFYQNSILWDSNCVAIEPIPYKIVQTVGRAINRSYIGSTPLQFGMFYALHETFVKCEQQSTSRRLDVFGLISSSLLVMIINLKTIDDVIVSSGLIGQIQYIKSGQSIDFLIFALFELEMDKKFAQNVGIAPSSDTATTGVNSVIFALTAIVIRCYLQLAVPPRPRVSMRSM